MARIYFDSNVYSNLRNNRVKKFIALNQALEKYKNNLLFVFSHAHIRDKISDLSDFKYLDFEFMKTFVNDNYLSYHAFKKRTSFYLASPLEVFETNDSLSSIDFVMNIAGGNYKEIRKLIKSGGDEILYSINNNKYDLNQLFKNDRIGDKFYDFIKDSLYHKDKDNIPYYDFYLHAYSILDILGFSKDKLNSKNSFNNIFNDSLHSYYSRYCDYLITDDEGLRKKSRLLYDEYEVLTKIMSVEQFLIQIDNIARKTEFSITDFFRKLHANLNIDKINGKYEGDGYVNYSVIIEELYFNFFDSLTVMKSEPNEIYVYLNKKENHLLSKPNYRECELITNNMISIFGNDLNGYSKFDFKKEIEEIRNEIWLGRYWDFGDTRIHLAVLKSSKEFCVQIGPLTQWDAVSKF